MFRSVLRLTIHLAMSLPAIVAGMGEEFSAS